ncbi:MAG: hypothetical protein SWH61_12680 [Thermodesulfobacteriota bacterium]|nr:hypothetical protein [Thermodesulfobacteriota bacterium]
MGEYPVKLLIMATMLEAKPFVKGLSLDETKGHPFPVFQGGGTVLVTSGIGKSRAAIATTYGCLVFEPQSVWNGGAAGALTEGHEAGGIYQIRKIVEHDRPNLLTRKPVSCKPDWLKKADKADAAVLATGDCPVIQAADRRRLAKTADLVDMEAAAVVQACHTFDLPCHVFKFISDTPGHTNNAAIIANIRRFRNPFFAFFQHMWGAG